MTSGPEWSAYTAGRVIMLAVLRSDRCEYWTRAELHADMADIAPAVVDEALAQLVEDGAVIRDAERVKASPCARCLDSLDLIAI